MNPVTTVELFQVVGIAAAAMAGFMGVFAGVFIWASNVRDKGIDRRLQAIELRLLAVEQLVERRHHETVELVERRHQETMTEVNRLRQETMSEFDRLRQDMMGEVDRLRQETMSEFNHLRQDMMSESNRLRQDMMGEVDRLRQETMSESNRLRQEMMRLNEEGERRHQELLRAIAPLYRHTHAADGQPIVPLPEIEPSGATAAPAPADD